MRASELLIVAALATGCSKRADKVSDPPAPAPAPQVAVKGVNSFEDCTRFVDKARPVIEEMTRKAGMPFGPGETAAFVSECTASTEPRTPLMDCVLAAKNEPAVRGCYPPPTP
jgi:hypothetical protein